MSERQQPVARAYRRVKTVQVLGKRTAVCFLALLPVAAFADRVFWGCGYGEPRILRSGQIACRQEVRRCKDMTLSCTRATESLFTVSDFADYIAASDDGQYIVGLSNRGSENAFWIRNYQGQLIQRKTHFLGPHYWQGIHYCSESVTNVREWFNEKDPEVRFQLKSGKLLQVTVRSCDGKDLQLLK
jgi:hypothetical protein